MIYIDILFTGKLLTALISEIRIAPDRLMLSSLKARLENDSVPLRRTRAMLVSREAEIYMQALARLPAVSKDVLINWQHWQT